MNTKELNIKISPGQLPLSFNCSLEGGGEGAGKQLTAYGGHFTKITHTFFREKISDVLLK